MFFSQAERERNRQAERWGNDYDDSHSHHEWGGIVASYLGKLLSSASAEESQRRLVQIAALCFSWSLAIDRKVTDVNDGERVGLIPEKAKADITCALLEYGITDVIVIKRDDKWGRVRPVVHTTESFVDLMWAIDMPQGSGS